MQSMLPKGEDNEVELGHGFRDLPGLALNLFLFEGVDQFDGREEANLAAVMFDGMDAERRCNVGLSCAWASDQDHVLGAVHELAAVQGPYSGFVDLAGGEVEAGQVFIGREAGGFHVIGDRPDLAFGQFSLQELRQDRDGSLKGRRALLNQISDGSRQRRAFGTTPCHTF